jgi:thiol-disulfide isomerase/thioredoxin
MAFNSPYVYHLEESDFDTQGRLVSDLINPETGRPYFSGTTLVLIQSPGCGHCTRLKPTYQQIANELTDVELATIDTSLFTNKKLVEAVVGHPIQGVPLLVKMRGGVVVAEYAGDRSHDDIVKFTR